MTPAERAAALAALQQEIREDCASPLAAAATQAVPGEGPLDPLLMLVGEQPGDEEDRAGRPFVGPAGRLLDRALAEAGIERGALYVTNAVKHFKFVQTGRRRLHQRPDAGDIAHYRPFLVREIALVNPHRVLALGATAAQAILRSRASIASLRGGEQQVDGRPVRVTIHPSYLLRLRGEPATREAEFARFVRDLERAAR
ncbi:UdgX family uracil-DNA binding protein [Roseomonas terrae]|jgi:uracil-DNA glycosylase family protein|uniref:Type-4 uracil-DNA glycosylase n=1 Tax=Neoroseomonas terrae TaxID=424799 RepID=A0ABS5EBN8_9PROT|nr:UdgX family uracil-DNA binding protein [Neoroseomonas terrae]MBR0648431.1 UdgX family uracil-DNA binding protein [Neoroseomonas terrae]